MDGIDYIAGGGGWSCLLVETGECGGEGVRDADTKAGGGAGDADLTTTLDGVHFEVKSRAAHSCLRFYEQAAKDATEASTIPVVLLRENGDTDFYVLVALSDLRALSCRVSALEKSVDD